MGSGMLVHARPTSVMTLALGLAPLAFRLALGWNLDLGWPLVGNCFFLWEADTGQPPLGEGGDPG